MRDPLPYIIQIKKNNENVLQDRTDDILSCTPVHGNWEVVFKNSPTKKYLYCDSNIAVNKIEGSEESKIEFHGNTYYRVDKYKDYVRLTDNDDKSIIVKSSEIRKNINDRYNYLVSFARQQCEIATNGKEEEEDSPYKLILNLLKNYESTDSTYLHEYLAGKLRNRPAGKNYIYPFGCNKSQKEAVEKCLSSNISVIEGPPGTGKTQTILNIIANLFLQHKSIALVSNNNAAIVNVKEKLEKGKDKGEDYGLIGALLGKKDNIKEFFGCDHTVKLNQDWLLDSKTSLSIQLRIQGLYNVVDEVFDKQIELQKCKSKLRDAEAEYREFKKYLNLKPKEFEYIAQKYFYRWDSSRLSSFKDFFIDHIYNHGKYIFYTKLICLFRYHILNLKPFINKGDICLSAINDTLYKKIIQELNNKILSLEKWINCHENTVDKFIDLSKTLFRHHYVEYFKRNYEKFKISDYRQRFNDFVKRFPLVMSSTFSLGTCSKKNFVYDYLIIDEASQASVPATAACFGMAKNVVVVGDSKQLQQIIEKNSLRASDFGVDECFDGVKHSILTSIKALYRNKDLHETLLREHYRCDPYIIEFCNKQFYNDGLVVMTHEAGEFPFSIINVNAGKVQYKEGSWINTRQEAETQEALNRLVASGIPENEIAVISPYRQHTNELNKTIPEQIEADTIHKFQGREKRVVIFNSVRNNINDFIDNPNLINVAVSRAKNKFILVTSVETIEKINDSNLGCLIKYINYIGKDTSHIINSPRMSVFDILYQGDDNAIADLQAKFGNSGSPAENIFHILLEELLKDDKFKNWRFKREYYVVDLVRDMSTFTDEERRFMKNSSRLDFLIFDNIDKSPVFAIEIDGSIHESEAQKKRDCLKDSILKKLKIKHKRYRTDKEVSKDMIINELTTVYNERNDYKQS